MKLIDVVKELVQKFWHDNTRPSSNQRDVLKLRKGVRGGEPHVKHFLDTTQTELYERFKNEHTQLNLGQRSFEKCKPWYVRICIDRNTCCCRYHVEFEYYYDTYRHIFCGLHTNIVQDFPLLQPSNASREFIHSIMCPRPEGQKYYKRSCLYGTCSKWSGFELLSHCIHETEEHEFGRMSVEMQNFKYITYQVDSAEERKKFALVKSQVI